jgi:hypothetical protein
MKLIANGCSFTFGHKDSENSMAPDWVWPSRFNGTKGFTDVTNLAVEGGSNDRVVRTTIEYFEKNKGIDLNNVVLVVQHPTPNRGEWFNIANKLWIGYVTTMEDVLYDISITDYTKNDLDKIQNDTKTERKVFEQYKSFVESDITEVIKYFKNIILLQTYCKQKGIKLLQVGLSARCLPRFYFKESRQSVSNNIFCKELYKMIDESIICDRFLTEIVKGNEESPDDGHPNEVGHDIIFRYIYNEIKKRWQI